MWDTGQGCAMPSLKIHFMMELSSMALSWTPSLGLFRGHCSIVLQLFFLFLPAYQTLLLYCAFFPE